MNKTLKTNYDKACNAYLKAFCDKHGFHYNPDCWIGGEVGGIIEISDNYVGLDTIRTDIDTDAPSDEFEQWYDYSLRLGMIQATTPTYRRWLEGCPRRSENEIADMEQRHAYIEQLKAELKDMVKETPHSSTTQEPATSPKPTSNE